MSATTQPALKVIDGGQKDRRALLRELYSAHGGGVHGRCRYLLKDATEAEEAMLEVFARALTHSEELRAEPSPLAWLMKLATHRCLHQLRAEQAPWRRWFERDGRARPEGNRRPRAVETRELVRARLSRVDVETQAAVVHSWVDGMTLEEVAAVLGHPAPTVRKRLEQFAALMGEELEVPTSAHLSEWMLRRLRAGELPSAESQQAWAHVTACTECHGVLKGIESNQARFEAEVPFERFAAGVERAMEDEAAEPSRPRLNGFLVVVAATVFLAMLVRPLLQEEHPPHRLKGGAWAELRIGGEGPQRAVVPGDSDTLLPGEQVRLGYVAGPYRYLLAVSVDRAGEVSVFYSEAGMSRPMEPGPGRHWMPDSMEFTGSGDERVVVVLSNKPLLVESVRAAASRAWEAARGDVAAISSLGVDGEEVHWLLQKH